MTPLIDNLNAIEQYILRNADKDIYRAYQLGKTSMRKSWVSDTDLIKSLTKGLCEYYQTWILTLPELEQAEEQLKLKVVQNLFETVSQTLDYNNKNVDKNVILFYLIGYVNDLIKRTCT